MNTQAYEHDVESVAAVVVRVAAVDVVEGREHSGRDGQRLVWYILHHDDTCVEAHHDVEDSDQCRHCLVHTLPSWAVAAADAAGDDDEDTGQEELVTT